MNLFYDTNFLLDAQKEVFETEEKFYISSITLNELENIKTSGTKDEETKYNARTFLNLLDEHEDKYEIILYHNQYFEDMAEFDLEKIPDNKIIACAYHLMKNGVDVLFVTKDKVCKETAAAVGLKTSRLKKIEEEYLGFKEVDLSEEELAEFYTDFSNPVNRYNLLENEYLVVKMNGVVVGKYKWRDNHYIEILYQKADSRMFGKIAPFNGDVYQQLALDSLNNNQITMLKGAPGSGKSYLALGSLFAMLEHGKIDKIIIFCNTVATRGSARLGFYPGSRLEKLLDSQIGNFLESKLGDKVAVERLVDDGQLVLLPLSDIRGYDTTGLNAAVYITEAQNLDIELMRLALQRIGDDCICVLDGDIDSQVDLSLYAGDNNGMRRASQIFRGHDIYGEVTLQNIYRSKIAKLAEEM